MKDKNENKKKRWENRSRYFASFIISFVCWLTKIFFNASFPRQVLLMPALDISKYGLRTSFRFYHSCTSIDRVNRVVCGRLYGIPPADENVCNSKVASCARRIRLFLLLIRMREAGPRLEYPITRNRGIRRREFWWILFVNTCF